MSTVTVKRGDTHDIVWTANADLTGATIRLLARRKGVTVELDATLTDAAAGEVTHTLSGELEAGTYDVELETTVGVTITTYPNDGYSRLVVAADL